MNFVSLYVLPDGDGERPALGKAVDIAVVKAPDAALASTPALI